MSNIKVVDVIERVNTIVVDTTKTRWPYEELLTWYNDAVLAVVNRRPDASIKNIDFTITPNKSKQTLPVDGLRWMDVVSNVLTGKPIRKTKRLQLDDQVPNWHKKPGGEVASYVFDERDPKTIYIYPQPTTAIDLNIFYTVAPSPVTITDFENDNTTLSIDDSYLNAIVDFMLYRAYSKDADYAANAQRAAQHYQVFQAELGDKSGIDTAFNPRNGRDSNAPTA
jgi:Family of unknown function (DUF6682)